MLRRTAGVEWWRSKRGRLDEIADQVGVLEVAVTEGEKAMIPHVNELTYETIGAAIEVHRALGPGLLESACQACLCRELSLRGIKFQTELSLPVQYKGVRLDCGYRIDVLVAELVVVEIKTVEAIAPVHDAQLLTYLRLGGWKVGLLINFNVAVLKHGIHRRIL